jgi:hypothetical protein
LFTVLGAKANEIGHSGVPKPLPFCSPWTLLAL